MAHLPDHPNDVTVKDSKVGPKSPDIILFVINNILIQSFVTVHTQNYTIDPRTDKTLFYLTTFSSSIRGITRIA